MFFNLNKFAQFVFLIMLIEIVNIEKYPFFLDLIAYI